MNTDEKVSNEILNKWAHEFAENCIHCYEPGGAWDDPDEKFWCSKCYARDLDIDYDIPDYCHDLNLAAKVEAKIPKDKRLSYIQNILFSLNGNICDSIASIDWAARTATAEQRVRAIKETMEGE